MSVFARLSLSPSVLHPSVSYSYPSCDVAQCHLKLIEVTCLAVVEDFHETHAYLLPTVGLEVDPDHLLLTSAEEKATLLMIDLVAPK